MICPVLCCLQALPSFTHSLKFKLSKEFLGVIMTSMALFPEVLHHMEDVFGILICCCDVRIARVRVPPAATPMKDTRRKHHQRLPETGICLTLNIDLETQLNHPRWRYSMVYPWRVGLN